MCKRKCKQIGPRKGCKTDVEISRISLRVAYIFQEEGTTQKSRIAGGFEGNEGTLQMKYLGSSFIGKSVTSLQV